MPTEERIGEPTPAGSSAQRSTFTGSSRWMKVASPNGSVTAMRSSGWRY